MSRTVPASLAPLSYSYYGGASYSYSYSYAMGQSYSAGQSYSQGPMESYGFDGFPGNPMLANAITTTRAALQRDDTPFKLGDGKDAIGANKITHLPKVDEPGRLAHYGGAVRASLVSFELLSGLTFTPDAKRGSARLTMPGADGEVPVVEMYCPALEIFSAQLCLVDEMAAKRDARIAEILTQVAPPVAYFASIMNLQAGRHRKTMELVTLALQFAYAVCMRFKHAFCAPRPSDLSSAIQPVIEVPMHPSFPAGHANESAMTAMLLARLAGTVSGSVTDTYLLRLAHRIGENRVVAGLHYPVDVIGGALMGNALGSYFLARCGLGQFRGGRFQLVEPMATRDPLGIKVDAGDDGVCDVMTAPGCAPFDAQAVPVSGLLRELWNEAQQEWT
jgi:membrane-associated phospholipid phosphatase